MRFGRSPFEKIWSYCFEIFLLNGKAYDDTVLINGVVICNTLVKKNIASVQWKVLSIPSDRKHCRNASGIIIDWLLQLNEKSFPFPNGWYISTNFPSNWYVVEKYRNVERSEWFLKNNIYVDEISMYHTMRVNVLIMAFTTFFQNSECSVLDKCSPKIAKS